MLDPKVVELYDRYLNQEIDRRGFLKQLAWIAGGTAAAYALLPVLERDEAQAQVVSPDDARLSDQYVRYPGAEDDVRAYQAIPKESPGPFAAVMVVHENRGLNPHIEDVARRLAVEGFLALAPDALSGTGGTPGDPDAAKAQIKKLDMDLTVQNFVAATAYLKTHPKSTGRVGVVGFCWGGAMANQMAVHSPEVAAAVPFYGRQPKAQAVSKIKAALLLHYAELDERINQGIADYETALKKAGVDYQLFVYPGAKHAFNNDTNAARYHPEAAQLAWQRTIAFFKEKLLKA